MFRSIPEAIFHYAKETPHKLALADDTCQVTYEEYARLIRRYAAALEGLGISREDKVVLEAEQSVPYLALEQALQLLGAVFIPLEHNCSNGKLGDIAQTTSAKLIITNQPVASEIAEVRSYAALAELLESVADTKDYPLPESTDVSEMLFSTGTTGKEKGIVLTHGNNIALALNVIHGVQMEKDNVELIPSPMNHSHGLRRYYANMYNGCTVIILGSVMNIRRLFYCLDNFGVNSMDLVPAAMTVILKLTKDKLSAYRDRLRYIQFGAAPMSEDVKARICQLLPNTRMYNFYGSTESGCTFIYNFNVPAPKGNCIGKPTYSTEVLLTDDDRKVIDPTGNVSGLLATRGGMNMLGYWRDPEETRKALMDGVVYSNDIAFFDADGDCILMGRKGDVINVGGNKVSPDEIETAAKRMEGIADCGCVPVPDAAKGQVPKLFVQMKAGKECNPTAIRTFLSQNLEPYKVPIYIEQIQTIPRSFNGKLLRKELMK